MNGFNRRGSAAILEEVYLRLARHVLLKEHLLTAEGQHITSCNTLFSGRNIPLKARITR